MAHYDTIIIGAGHNSLVCANYLALKKKNVLVVEASEVCGGLAASYEFHDGFHASVAHQASHFPLKIIRDLRLTEHGLSLSRNHNACIGLDQDGHHVVVQGNKVSGVPDIELDAYKRYHDLMIRYADMLAPFWLKTVPPIGNNSIPEMMAFAELGLKIRLLGKEDMREFLRMVTLPMYDLMDEYFSHPLLKSVLSWDALIGSKQAPRSPNNSVLQLLYRMAGDSHITLEVPALIDALQGAAVSRGVDIRTSSRVSNIEVEQGSEGISATGVRLESGEVFTADRIVSSADPKTTFLNLLGAEHLEIEFTNRISRVRDQGLVSKLHLALSGLPSFTGLTSAAGRLFIAPSLEKIEIAFDNAKYGESPVEPVMEITVPTLGNPGLAPEGQHVLSAHVMYTPFKHKSAWDEAARTGLTTKVIDAIETYAPGTRSLIIGQELLTPVDLESRFNTSGGHWHHGDFALDQLLMMRPTPGAAQYGTPVSGLYLCGAGTHPAGDITGMPGHNAARKILS
ncbi:MAG: NAD(P)/FAD-dependent oxidoreductase [bacterium]|nr:NAD(P)/FAD-dependent oxidoreductase [Gammaproteobacteria bacterium]HIL85037.1 NAD(P)/FAD-dependent oxidoreductase [Pseudomonadales bacterium]